MHPGDGLMKLLKDKMFLKKWTPSCSVLLCSAELYIYSHLTKEQISDEFLFVWFRLSQLNQLRTRGSIK